MTVQKILADWDLHRKKIKTKIAIPRNKFKKWMRESMFKPEDIFFKNFTIYSFIDDSYELKILWAGRGAAWYRVGFRSIPFC